jgi:hypothetical protein
MYGSLKLTNKGKTKTINKLVIDAGAAKSLISVGAVKDAEILIDLKNMTITR